MLTQSETKRGRSVSSSLPSTREERSRSSIYLLVAPSLPRIPQCSRIDHGRETRRMESWTRYSVCKRLSEDLLSFSLPLSLSFIDMRMLSVPDTVTSSNNDSTLRNHDDHIYTLARTGSQELEWENMEKKRKRERRRRKRRAGIQRRRDLTASLNGINYYASSSPSWPSPVPSFPPSFSKNGCHPAVSSRVCGPPSRHKDSYLTRKAPRASPQLRLRTGP